jgi:hypothetical protein
MGQDRREGRVLELIVGHVLHGGFCRAASIYQPFDFHDSSVGPITT